MYNESFPATCDLGTIVEMKPVASTDSTLTVRIVQRVTAEDEYKVKVERWNFVFGQGAIQSVKVVPDTTKYLDRYTLSRELTQVLGSLLRDGPDQLSVREAGEFKGCTVPSLSV